MIHYIIFDRTPMRISSLFNLFAFLIREHAYILHSEMHFEICHFMKNKLYIIHIRTTYVLCLLTRECFESERKVMIKRNAYS